jgi:hypothetical protein
MPKGVAALIAVRVGIRQLAGADTVEHDDDRPTEQLDQGWCDEK